MWINRDKAKNAVSSTSFDNLKKIEENKGFNESIIARENKKNIPFFLLGPKNDWQKNFDDRFIQKLNDIFKRNLIELNYQ